MHYFCRGHAEFSPSMQFKLVHISAGDLLRAEVASGSENGKKAESFMSQGFLVPNELVRRLRPIL